MPDIAALRAFVERVEALYNETRDEDLSPEEKTRRKELRKELATERCALRAMSMSAELHVDRLHQLRALRRELDLEEAALSARLTALFRSFAGWQSLVEGRLNLSKEQP